jgi:hypothetical protein
MTSQVETENLRISTVVARPTLSRPATWQFPVFAGLILICAITLAAGNLLSIGFTFEENYNEGWNVYNAQRVIAHELIYDDNYWRVNNYPIFSFLVVAGLNYVIDNLLLSGRIIALVSFISVGFLAGVAIQRFGGDRVDAVFGGGCALGFCFLVAPAWVAVDDPQTLGEAIMLSGLVSYISRPPDGLNLLRTAFLVVLGGFIKHNIVAIPLAITFDLAIRSPRRLLVWCVFCAGLVAGCLLLTHLVAGGSFIDHLLSPRICTWYSARYHLIKYLRLSQFPLALVILFARAIFSGDRRILAYYGILSIISATIASSFEGTSYNMFQDAAAFLAVAAGVMLRELRSRMIVGALTHERVAKLALSLAPLLLAQPILARSPQAFVQIYHVDGLLDTDRRTEQSFLAEVKYISEKHGLAVCESLLLCYFAGQPFTIDPFNSRQFILAGRLDQYGLIQRIATKEFAVVQLRADICDDLEADSCHILHYRRKFSRFTDDVLYAVDRHYRIAWRSHDGTFYVPK